MNRTGGTGQLLRAILLLEYGFLLPVFDHPRLGRDDVQLLLDLAEASVSSAS